MPRWLRVMRGMVGTGLTFAAGVGVVSAVVGTAGLLAGEVTWVDLFRMVGKLSVVASFVGVVFSGVLAIVARRKSFDTLSLPFVTAVGAGGARNFGPTEYRSASMSSASDASACA